MSKMKYANIPYVDKPVSSPNYGLADQVNDPRGGGCVSLSGP